MTTSNTAALITLITLSLLTSSYAEPICTEEFLLQRSINNSRETCRTIHQEVGDIYSLVAAFQSIIRQAGIDENSDSLSAEDNEVLDVLKWNTSNIDQMIKEKKTSTVDTYNVVFPQLDIFPADKLTLEIFKSGEKIYSGPMKETPTLPSDKKWVFLFHGMGAPDQLESLKERFLQEDVYIVIPDYSVGSQPLFYYPFSLYGTMGLIKNLRELMWDVLKPEPKDTIFIGHSFGGQVGGILAQEVLPERFVGLDPAGPLFDYLKIPSLNIYSGIRSISYHTSRPWGSVRSKSTTDIFINDRRHRYHECTGITMMCNHQSSIVAFLQSLGNKFALFGDDIYYQKMDLSLNLKGGIFNSQSHLRDHQNTREVILVSSV